MSRQPTAAALGIGAVCVLSSVASAAFVEVIGGPTFTPGVGGYKGFQPVAINSGGTAVAQAARLSASTVLVGERAIRWDSSAAFIELGNLGTSPSGNTNSYPYAINDQDIAVGYAEKYTAGGMFVGQRPVRWDQAGTVHELPMLGNSTSGSADGEARAVNGDGRSVGFVDYFDPAGTRLGLRAVRWAPDGSNVTQLGVISTHPDGQDTARALAINRFGAAAGTQDQFNEQGQWLGQFGVRWDAATGAATRLGNVGVGPRGEESAVITAINDAGTVIGTIAKYDSQRQSSGGQPVRWVGSSAVPTPLDVLGTSITDNTGGLPKAINAAGTVVGGMLKYTDDHQPIGSRAVRWDADDPAAHELGTLGTDAFGATTSDAFAVNNAGVAVGFADLGGNFNLKHATFWRPDGTVVDLNSLIDPQSGWTLSFADAISDTGWIAGRGCFDPDGAAGGAGSVSAPVHHGGRGNGGS